MEEAQGTGYVLHPSQRLPLAVVVIGIMDSWKRLIQHFLKTARCVVTPHSPATGPEISGLVENYAFKVMTAPLTLIQIASFHIFRQYPDDLIREAIAEYLSHDSDDMGVEGTLKMRQ